MRIFEKVIIALILGFTIGLIVVLSHFSPYDLAPDLTIYYDQTDNATSIELSESQMRFIDKTGITKILFIPITDNIGFNIERATFSFYTGDIPDDANITESTLRFGYLVAVTDSKYIRVSDNSDIWGWITIILVLIIGIVIIFRLNKPTSNNSEGKRE